LLLGLAVSAASCGPCGNEEDRVYLLRDPPADVQALLDACRDPAQKDCMPLCDRLRPAGQFRVELCEVFPDHDGYTEVHVKWSPLCE
jgi:hypothetical protein